MNKSPKTKERFFELLDRALVKRDQSKLQTKAESKSGNYSGKQTHQRKSANASH